MTRTEIMKVLEQEEVSNEALNAADTFLGELEGSVDAVVAKLDTRAYGFQFSNIDEARAMLQQLSDDLY